MPSKQKHCLIYSVLCPQYWKSCLTWRGCLIYRWKEWVKSELGPTDDDLLSISQKFPMSGICWWIPYSRWGNLQRKMLCYSNWLEHCVICIYNDWFIGSLYSPLKIVPFATKGKYNLTFHSVRFACFSSWNNTLWDLCRSPISMLHYPRSHWFESFLEPHNSFLLSLGSATSKTFVFNLPLIPLI